MTSIEPAIWTALLKRNLTEMQRLLTENPSNINALHPRVRGTLLDSAIYWGYLPESKLLHQYGGKTNSGSPLAGAVMLAKMDLINWVYDTLDKNVNNTAITGSIFASTQTTDLEKFGAFEFMMNHGADPTLYSLNAVLLSPLATKYLVENGLLDLNISAGNNRTLLDELELRNITNPFVDGLSQFQLGASRPDDGGILGMDGEYFGNDIIDNINDDPSLYDYVSKSNNVFSDSIESSMNLDLYVYPPLS
jgi:hypothetical protein